MDYIVARGKKAKEISESKNQSYSDLLKRIPKPGQAPLVVKLLGDEDYVLYEAHTNFKPRINTTPCSKPAGKEDLYDKAAALMFEDIKAELEAGVISEEEAKEKRRFAAQLLPKRRYLFGFVDLSTGEPIIVEMTEKQGNAVIEVIENYAKYIDKKAFELGKSGSGTNTSVVLMPVIELDELTEEQQANFEKYKGKEFDSEAFGKLFRFKSEEEQARDLLNFGFDVTRLGIDPDALEKKDTDANSSDDAGEQVSGEEKAKKLF